MSKVLKFASVFLIFSFVFLLLPADVFGTTAGPNSPGTNANDSSVGTKTWTSLDNDKTSNNQYATTANMNSGDVTVYLKATNFGFSIPAGVIIDGISVNVERKASDANFFDNAIRIVKNGTVGTVNKSSVNAWPTSDGTVTYGGSSDLWGQTWTVADINNANFGFAISAKKVGGNNNKKPSIDWINITVTYHTPTPPTVTISAAPSTITIGQSSTLTWSTTNATLCTASDDWSGSKSTSGSESVTPVSTGIKTYTLSCSGTEGSASNTATVIVNNPVPTTTSISPSSKTVGDAEFTMTVNGTNFINGSIVRLNGSDRATTHVSSTRLTAIIPVGDMAISGTYPITVFNSAPGGGTSNAQTFTVNAITIGTVNLDGYLINPATCATSALGGLASSVTMNMTGPSGSGWSSTNLNLGAYSNKPIGSYTLNSVSISDGTYRPSNTCGYTNGMNNSAYPNPQTLTGGSTITFRGVFEVSPPNAPSALSATGDLCSQISLSWTDNSSVEAGFRIERKTGSGGTWSEIATVSADTTTYLNPGLSESTDYYYRVRAYNATGNSSYSNESNASTPACPVTIGTVNLDGYLINPSTCATSPLGSLTVNFNMTGPVGSSWTNIDLSSGSYTSKPIGSYTLNSVSVSDATYRPSNTCGYTNGMNNSSYSNPQTLTGGGTITFRGVFEVSPPNAPSALSVIGDSCSQSSLSWTDNSSVETGYRIERKTGAGGTWAEIATVSADTTTYLNPGLSESTDYYYRVRAYNSTGYSNYSNETSVSTPACPILIGTVNLDGYLVNASTCTESPLGSLASSVDLNMTGPAGSSWSSTNLNPGSYVSKPIGDYTLNSVSVSDSGYRISNSCGYTDGINNATYPNPQTLTGGGSLTFKGVVEEVPPPPSCALSVSPASLSFTDANQTGAVTASGAVGTVSWASGNVSIVTVDPDSGNSTTVTSKTSTSASATITATDSGVLGCSDSVSVTITSTVTPPVVPPVIVPGVSSSEGGISGGVSPTQARFSGQAYPGSKIEVLYRSNIDDMFKNMPILFYSMSPEGIFETTLTALLGGNYLFALRAEDKDGRKTGVWSFKIDFLSTNDLVAENLFVPPTIGFLRNAIRKGDFVTIVGYAAPLSIMDIEIDGKPIDQNISAGYDGFYKVLVETADLSFGTHSARARQKNKDGKLSDFSQQVTFTVSKLFFPQTDLNSDGQIDIKDWSIFLSKWSSSDPAVRARLDFNGDGQVNLSDFSLFVRTLNKK
jgi:hypothetical protein